jgi:hypothetical protein
MLNVRIKVLFDFRLEARPKLHNQIKNGGSGYHIETCGLLRTTNTYVPEYFLYFLQSLIKRALASDYRLMHPL